MTGVLNLGATTLLNMPGGVFRSYAVIAGQRYHIDSDTDLFIREGGQGLKRFELDDANSDGLVSTQNAPGSEFDFGTGDISFEAWVHINDENATAGNRFTVGQSGSNPRLSIWIGRNSGGNIDGVVEMLGAGGATEIFTDNNPHDLGFDVAGQQGDLQHYVFVMERAASGNKPRLRIFVSSALIINESAGLNNNDDGTAFDLSGISGARLGVGANAGGAAGSFDGNFYGCRYYNRALSATQVAHRSSLGPARLPTDGIVPVAIVDPNASDTWADPSVPEVQDASYNSLFALSSTTSFTDGELNSGAIANVDQSQIIHANQPVLATAGSGVTHFNFYTRPDAEAEVRISAV